MFIFAFFFFSNHKTFHSAGKIIVLQLEEPRPANGKRMQRRNRGGDRKFFRFRRPRSFTETSGKKNDEENAEGEEGQAKQRTRRKYRKSKVHF